MVMLRLMPLSSPLPPAPLHAHDQNRDVARRVVPTHRQILRLALTLTAYTLFPGFKTKNSFKRIEAVFAAPAIFALTITLPVVVSHSDHDENAPSTANAVTTFEDEIEHPPVSPEEELDISFAEEEVLAEMHRLKFNKWLMAVQCAFGPLFCIAVLFSTSGYLRFLSQREPI
jgi:sodium/potassium/calcium exchanger 6